MLPTRQGTDNIAPSHDLPNATPLQNITPAHNSTQQQSPEVVVPDDALTKSITTHTVICVLSAACGILFFPLVLLVLLTKCVNNPSDWRLDQVNESVKIYSNRCKWLVALVFIIAIIVWAIIAGLTIPAFGIGVVILIIVAICTFFFILAAIPPYTNVKKAEVKAIPV